MLMNELNGFIRLCVFLNIRLEFKIHCRDKKNSSKTKQESKWLEATDMKSLSHNVEQSI